MQVPAHVEYEKASSVEHALSHPKELSDLLVSYLD